jgi:hypothetical protein
VVWSVDDYGSVRLGTPHAPIQLSRSGLNLEHPMDRLDGLETRSDLEELFEVLGSHRDNSGRPACFTAYTLMANPDFQKLREGGDEYAALDLAETFEYFADTQSSSYRGAWQLWQDGLAKGLIFPQSHGREHLNIEVVNYKLRTKAADLMANLECDSMAALADVPELPGLNFTRAFAWGSETDFQQHARILSDGLQLFQKLFGFRSQTFTAPSMLLHPALHHVLTDNGVEALDCARRDVFPGCPPRTNRLGQSLLPGLTAIVRNVAFEPIMGPDLAVTRALDQVAAAFRLRKPAIISSHRANFSGLIDSNNRRQGLQSLGLLLSQIVRRWPDVEFLNAAELVQLFRVKS